MRPLSLPLASLVLGSLGLAQDLDAKLRAITEAPEFKHAHWGILLCDAKTGEVVLERDADKLFAPASTTKLYSVAAALRTLGKDFRFETQVARRGEVDAAGRLNGDLILVASGDPTLGGRTDADGHVAFTRSDHIYANGNESAQITAPDPLAGLDALAREIAAAGVRSVSGEILVDDRLFDHESSTGSGPRRLTPMIVNDNLIDVVITPTKDTQPARVEHRPHTSVIQIDAQVTTAASGAATSVRVTMPSPGRLQVRGAIAEGHAPLVRTHEVDDPAAFARTLLIEALRRAGLTVAAAPSSANPQDRLPPRDEVAKLARVATFRSPPFAEHARLILKVSHNLHASLLPMLLAVRAGKRTLRDGLKEQRGALLALGVDADTISFGGGAGGSPADRTTPRATVQLLLGIDKLLERELFRRALPVLGVDGTLSRTVGEQSPARGKVRAKTGTYWYDNPMNGNTLLTSKALAGWIATDGGRELAFCFVVNGVHLKSDGEADRIGQVLGRMCEVVVTSS